MTLKSIISIDLIFTSAYIPYFAEYSGELHVLSRSRSKLSFSRAVRIINPLWALCMLLTAGKTYRSFKLSCVVSLKKLTFAMPINFFIYLNVFSESKIDFVMDRFHG